MNPAATIWPPSLVSASSSIRSSTTPTAQIIAPAISTMPASWNTGGLRGAQERQVPGDQQSGAETAEHGHAAEVRDRGGVHVAVAHPRHGPGPDRQLAGEDAQQVAGDAGHEEDEQVLTHVGRPASSARSSDGRSSFERTAFEHGPARPQDAPRAGSRGRVPVQSTIVEALLPALRARRRGPPRPTRRASCSAESASVAAGSPVTFAEETAVGPVRPRRSRATSSSGIRTATVPRVSPRSQRSEGCCRHTIVSGPGQYWSISRSPTRGGRRRGLRGWCSPR